MTEAEQLAAVTDDVHKLRHWFEAKVARCTEVMARNEGDHMFTVESEQTMCSGVLDMMDEFGLGTDTVPNPLAKARMALRASEDMIRWELKLGLTDEHREMCDSTLKIILEAF